MKTDRILNGFKPVRAGYTLGIIAVAAKIALAAAPTTSSAPASSRPAPGAIYHCADPTFKLKGVWAGDKVQHTFVVENQGFAPLLIEHIEAACGCFVAEDYTRSIAPGQTGTIDVSLQTARGSRQVHKEMQVETNDPLHPKNLLIIEGPLTPRIEVDPVFGANWNRLYPGADLTRVVKLTNHFTEPMKLKPVNLEKLTDYTATLKELEPGQRAELTVTARKDLPTGPHMQFLTLKTGFKDEPELVVPCTLYVPPEFEATPIAFSVFDAPGQIDKQTLLLRWNGPMLMHIASVQVSETGMKTALTEKEPGRAYVLEVTMPSDATPATGEVQIVVRTDLKDRPEIKIPLKPRSLPVGSDKK